MPGYFGTEAQRRLQAQAEDRADWIDATPGACQPGRFMGCDDPDRFGWEAIDKILQRDGVFGFRMLPVGKVDDIVTRLTKRGFRMDFWDVFIADRSRALEVSQDIVARGLRGGLLDFEMPVDPGGEYTIRIQTLMAGAGIVPFSGSMLTGKIGPATTVVVGDTAGSVVAAAHGYFPHNRYSPYHRYAFGGLAAVAESHRGGGLGRYINARLVVSMFSDLKAESVYEVVTATNAPSRRMLEACGLRFDSTVVSGLAVASDSARFSR